MLNDRIGCLRPVLAAMSLAVWLVPDAVAGRLAFIGVHRYGVAGVEELLGSQRLAIAPGGEHVYVPGFDSDRISVFLRNGSNGALTLTSLGVSIDVPSSVAVSPDGVHAYATEQSTGVQVFSRNATTGALTFLAVYDDNTTAALNGPASIAVSPDGQHVYVGCFPTDSIVVFSRNSITGLLTFVEQQTDGVGGVDGINNVKDLTLTPDGLHLYATGQDDQAVAAFSRNVGTGALTFVEVQRDGVGGVDGLLGALDVTVSGDGAHVYTTGGEQKVAVFSRNVGTGALTFVEAEAQPMLLGTRGVAVSPDGTQAYVTGWGSDRLAVFTRDTGTGALTLVEMLEDGLAGVTGLFSPFDVVVSPDNAHVYVSAEGGAVVAFRRIDHTCSATPLGGCHIPAEPQKSKLVVKDNLDDARDLVVWRWRRGDTVAVGDFGDPITGGTDYAVCLYDAAVQPQPQLTALFPAGGGCGSAKDHGALSCWKSLGGRGFRYSSRNRNPDGVSPVSLKAGPAPTSQVSLKGKGEALPLPALPLIFPVTVQLQASNGSCWTATYSTATQNTATLVQATSD